MTEAVAESIEIGVHGPSVPQRTHLCGSVTEVMGSTVLENLYYVPPDEFGAG
jgi:hypothetical protein